MTFTESGMLDFYVGGGLPPDARSYVVRPVDDEMFDALRSGHLCYVLNARQMGKSSLCNRTLTRLREKGVATAIIDVSVIDMDAGLEASWYAGLVHRINSAFRVMDEEDLDLWWKNQRAGPLSNLGKFIEEHLTHVDRPECVIFFDEIDSLIASSVGDGFFTLLRSIHNRRPSEPQLRKLTFALIGVASPSELISDKNHTPFNIGYPIELKFFTFAESHSALLPLLSERFQNPDRVLKRVIDWTGGQPFLTQKVCSILVSQSTVPIPGEECSWIDGVVGDGIVKQWESQDEPVHLRTIRDRILQSPKQIGARLLGLMQRIQAGEAVVSDDSDEQVELRLSGFVVEAKGHLVIANQIYAEVFTADWISRALSSLRPYGETIEKWQASHPRDPSFLLRGTALKSARNWASGRALPGIDFEYLDASGRAETDLIEVELNAERKANEILRSARKKAVTGMVCSAIAAGIVSASLVIWSTQEKESNQKRTKELQARASQAQTSYQRAFSKQAETSALLASDRAQLSAVKKELDSQYAALKQAQTRSAIAVKAANQKIATAKASAEVQRKVLELQVQTERAQAEEARKQAQLAEANANVAKTQAKKAQSESVADAFASTVRAELLSGESGIMLLNGVDQLAVGLQTNDELRDLREERVEKLLDEVPEDKPASRALLYYLLYRGGHQQVWKDKLFDLLRTKPDCLSLELTESTWDQADRDEIVLQIATTLLANPGGSSTKDSLDSLWEFRAFRAHDLRERQWKTYFDLVQVAIVHWNDLGARDFLNYEAPAAYWTKVAQYLAGHQDSSKVPQTEVIRYLGYYAAPGGLPRSLESVQWQKWVSKNRGAVSLWSEHGLATLRKSPGLVSQSEEAIGFTKAYE